MHPPPVFFNTTCFQVSLPLLGVLQSENSDSGAAGARTLCVSACQTATSLSGSLATLA